MTKNAHQREKDLLRREKPELVAIIQYLLQQRPELEWMLQTPLPVGSRSGQSLDPELYRRPLEKAISAVAEHHRDRNYREQLTNLLKTLQTMAEEFARQEEYAVALTLYEVLVAEAIKHFSDIEIGYLLFTPLLVSCIDGLDTCFADVEEKQEIRQRVLKALFAIYTFSANSYTDLGEDIPDLLVENTTDEERQMIVAWVSDAWVQPPSKARLADETSRKYSTLLHRLKKEVE
jgi:hypothetical protein